MLDPYPDLMDPYPDLINPNPQLCAVLRIRDVYPGSRILIFTHPGSRIQKQQQKREVKKICWLNFLCSHKFHKIANYISFFEVQKKKIWANFQRIIELFTQKIVTQLSKIWMWDPGSGKNLFRIPDPGVRKVPDPGSGSATLRGSLPQSWIRILLISSLTFKMLVLNFSKIHLHHFSKIKSLKEVTNSRNQGFASFLLLTDRRIRIRSRNTAFYVWYR
jgi:hypothetical protein